jgi:hypothetical protein
MMFRATLIVLVFVLPTGPAHAYLDPGTGSIILQMLLGGVAGGLVVVRLYWARIRLWFSPSKEQSPPRREDGDV